MKEKNVRYSIETGFMGKYRICKKYTAEYEDCSINYKAYLHSCYKGKYKWYTDHTWAQDYTLETAEKHLEALRKARRNETRKNH